jgi:trk system potassium uptake protein TrkH
VSSATLLNLLGYLNLILAGTMIFPLCVNWLYHEPVGNSFLFSMAITAACGFLLILLFRRSPRDLTHRDGFAIVAFGWLSVAFFGALPYLFSGSLPSLTDAFFESASGFTTTGATVLTNVEKQVHAVLFWRSFTQWLGGMGIVLLSLAVLPYLGVGGMQLYKAEVPGPTYDKLRPRISETARILWQVYVVLSILEVLFLFLGGMNLFDALCHTFTTMATGGFSTKNASIEQFANPFLEYVIVFFMLLAGANFALHYELFRGKFESLWRNEEFRFYLLILLSATCLIALNLRYDRLFDFSKALRLALFQATSIMTTTGYSSADFETWPFFSQYLLLILMFIGGCAGSTGGAIKCVRVLVLVKQSRKELSRLVHPRAVIPVKMAGKAIPPETLQGIWGLFFLYLCIFAIASVLLSLMGQDLLTAVSAVAATLGNVGPGLGTVGPTENYAHLPIAAKWILSACMLLGRLEIYTLMVLLLPEFWRK